MDEHKRSIETLDDTPVDLDMTESDLDAEVKDAAAGESSIELTIETLAGVDAADAADLADEVATRLRAQLSDS